MLLLAEIIVGAVVAASIVVCVVGLSLLLYAHHLERCDGTDRYDTAARDPDVPHLADAYIDDTIAQLEQQWEGHS